MLCSLLRETTLVPIEPVVMERSEMVVGSVGRRFILSGSASWLPQLKCTFVHCWRNICQVLRTPREGETVSRRTEKTKSLIERVASRVIQGPGPEMDVVKDTYLDSANYLGILTAGRQMAAELEEGIVGYLLGRME